MFEKSKEKRLEDSYNKGGCMNPLEEYCHLYTKLFNLTIEDKAFSPEANQIRSTMFGMQVKHKKILDKDWLDPKTSIVLEHGYRLYCRHVYQMEIE